MFLPIFDYSHNVAIKQVQTTHLFWITSFKGNYGCVFTRHYVYQIFLFQLHCRSERIVLLQVSRTVTRARLTTQSTDFPNFIWNAECDSLNQMAALAQGDLTRLPAAACSQSNKKTWKKQNKTKTNPGVNIIYELTECIGNTLVQLFTLWTLLASVSREGS